MPEPLAPDEATGESHETPSSDGLDSGLATAEERSDGSEPGLLSFPIVAIGGSAGGVEAFLELFQYLPPDTGMAFIVVSHLAPSHKSHLVEILSSRVAMPVTEIQDQMIPEPNHVYVLPPNAVLTISRGVLQLAPRPEHRPVLVIDEFFRSLAADQKNRSVGVVLSGMDSDGALGLKVIKGEGGIAIVQAPESARFPSMPRSSIGADHVDLVVPPADIGLELARLASQFLRPELRSLEDGQAPVGQEQQFTRILNMLSGVSNIDFRGYKPATLQRRIARRMLLKRFETLADYLRYLQVHNEELNELHEDALIGVSRFFRDPDVFNVLKSDILPRIFENRESGQQVRIWVAGCSTGEEVYSIAISLLEHVSGEAVEPPIQIFGTDASDSAIQRARAGIFPESISAELSPERLRRFFLKVDKGYQVTKRVRDLCIFARQNLCNDPPFGHLDLISCRNVLIYLGQELQKRIIPTFHYALRPNGFLLLGASETIRGHSDLFAPLDRQHKFYRKLSSPTPLHLDTHNSFYVPEGHHAARPGHHPAPDAWTDLDLQRAADRIVLARYGPPGVIINEKLEILQSRGHTSPFLELAQGASSLHLLRMLRDSIASQVHDAVRRAVEQDVAVHIPNLMVRDGDQFESASLEVLPIHTVTARARAFLILFAPSNSQAEGGAPLREVLGEPASVERDRFIADLNNDLTATKLYLQSLIEERDTRNQELVSANEEIQSANEELQSANEELETTKEELQSSNEELQTVNEELQQRNSVLTQTSNDLTNLLNSVNLPLLMLNNDLQIRQFTPLTQRLMNIRSSDIGRPINEIRLNLSIDNLEPVLLEVLESLGTRELEVQDRDGHWMLMRVRPYRTADNKIEGVVLVMVDIDELRRSQQELRDARDYARAVVESMRTPVVVLNMDLKIRTVNSAFRSLSGIVANDLEQRSFPELAALLWNMEEIRPRLEEFALNHKDAQNFEFQHEFEQGLEKKVFRVWARTLLTDGERVILITIEDISAQKTAEHLQERLQRELEVQIHSTEETLGRTQTELRALAGRLFTSQEEERRRVSRELHDDITQQLAHLQIEIEGIQQNPPASREEVARRMEALSQKTSNLSNSIRTISHRLHPSILEDLGLAEAIKSLIDEFRLAEGMPTTFRRNNVPEDVPIQTAGALYRVAQEALHNVAKHAGKTHVKVSLEGSDSRLRLEIKDSGEGFDMHETNRGLGLVSMAERARLVQGVFSIESALGAGTTIRVDVPLPSAPGK
jgi:two-component system CheB/CheR fusion protein